MDKELEEHLRETEGYTSEMGGKVITVRKGEVLQRQGELSTNAYYVVEGLVRSYSIDEKGKEHIFLFAPEGWTVADAALPDQPAELFIDAIEDSRLLALEKGIQLLLAGDETRLRQQMEKLLRRVFVLQKRVTMLMSAPAVDRYQHFLEMYPDIVQRVPQRMIASYLGITPEALSKVKGEMNRKR